MSGDIYARLNLDAPDLELIRRMLVRGAESCTCKAGTASDPDERSFYQRTGRLVREMLAQFETVSPGVVAFTEDDLKFVRGMVFPVLFPELMARYQERASLTEEEALSLRAEIDHLTDLERRFDQPFIDDTSMDPEPDDDDEEAARP